MTVQAFEILVVRHGKTTWNLEKRLQGRRDIPLSDEGFAQLAGKRPPQAFASIPWYVSPLLRAQQTAKALGINDFITTEALIEMNWGDWEGERLPELRRRLGPAMQQEEDKGLDLSPPNGESPRQVRTRILTWLQTAGFATEKIGLVTHKGVIRALLSEALDWQMLEACPVKIRWDQALLFRCSAEGIELLDYNIPLDSSG
ncbi:histidine phosphatase family protein [Marinobacterium lutimaris]|uniref:Probable phosphoglycerate mutase n=1 Tax=Marinobacterium lutimaris TaxID=568106 RepID=A0A1H6D6Y2_9GAMM|nr:histidine phosphatase family protein [Marinobacterium lutimaris]SEG81149.1 probable phosphoglycerate mutase [Marinobacterium lutimaris]